MMVPRIRHAPIRTWCLYKLVEISERDFGAQIIILSTSSIVVKDFLVHEGFSRPRRQRIPQNAHLPQGVLAALNALGGELATTRWKVM
jgi:hypothetical protein